MWNEASRKAGITQVRTSISLSFGLGLNRNFPAGIPSEIGGQAHHQDSTRRLVTSIAFYQILCLRLRPQNVPQTTLSDCGRELRGTRILSWLLPQGCFVFHQLQNWSLCQQLIVSAARYSLNKVRPKLTPGKPTLAAATLPQLGRACSKQGRAGLLQLLTTEPFFGHRAALATLLTGIASKLGRYGRT